MNYFPLRQLCVVLGHDKVNHKYYKYDILSYQRVVRFNSQACLRMNWIIFLLWHEIPLSILPSVFNSSLK